MNLDTAFKVQSLVATAGNSKEMPEVGVHSANGISVLHAEMLSSLFAPEGWITKVKADGNVSGTSPEGALSAQAGELEMYPRVNEAKLSDAARKRADGYARCEDRSDSLAENKCHAT